MGTNRTGLVQHVLFVGIEELELIDRRVLELIGRRVLTFRMQVLDFRMQLS
jgi:hypothetical protein